MSRITTNLKLAAALMKTLKRLESDSSVDPHDPAFVQLKCTLLQKLMGLQVNTAEIEASLHLVPSPAPESAPIDDDEETAIA